MWTLTIASWDALLARKRNQERLKVLKTLVAEYVPPSPEAKQTFDLWKTGVLERLAATFAKEADVHGIVAMLCENKDAPSLVNR